MMKRLLALLVLAALLLAGCGNTPEPATTLEPTPEATPEPTPEPTPTPTPEPEPDEPEEDSATFDDLLAARMADEITAHDFCVALYNLGLSPVDVYGVIDQIKNDFQIANTAMAEYNSTGQLSVTTARNFSKLSLIAIRAINFQGDRWEWDQERLGDVADSLAELEVQAWAMKLSGADLAAVLRAIGYTEGDANQYAAEFPQTADDTESVTDDSQTE